MNLETLKSTLNYILDNNLKLMEKGLPKTAVNIIGDAGTGKTSIVEQIAQERNAKFIKLSLAQMEETGDFLGLPVKMYAMISPEGEEIWVAEKTIEPYIKLNYKLCASCEPRMDYAVPAWVPLHEDGEVILLLDDYTRANNIILQGIMNLVQCGEFGSWKLPKKCHIILTSNFDNGSYNLNSVDSAMTSRMLNFTADFDVKVFAKWAENVGMRNEFINFAILNPDIFNSKNLSVNARNYTMFANACSGIKDLEKGLSLINNIAKGSFGEEEYISGKFCTFINNRLDKLPSPERMLHGDWQEVHADLTEAVYRNGVYRSDISSVLTLRFTNFASKFMRESTSKTKAKDIIDRCSKIIHCEDTGEVLLSNDHIFILIRELVAQNPGSMAKLLTDPKIRAKIMD